jgi:hypothetical protein
VASEGDEDTDTQGVGLVPGRNSRFVSDPLRFTGTDLGDRSNNLVMRRPYDSDEANRITDDETSNSDDDEDDEDEFGYDEEELARLSPRQREEVLVQTAMARIKQAQENGRTDVRLNKDELAALERRRKRLEEEAEKKKKRKGDSERKKKKDNRMSIPLAQLDPGSAPASGSASSRKTSKSSQRQPSLPRHGSGSSLVEGAEDAPPQVYPPMGYFPPPSGGRSRQRSSTSASQRPPSRLSNVDPYEFEYGPRASSASRHVSDGTSRPRSSRGYYGEDMASAVNSRQLDPFQFQTAGPRAPYHSGAAAASRRHASGASDAASVSRRGTPTPPMATRSHRSSRRPSPDDETSEAASESSEESTSDDLGNGAQIRQPPTTRGRTAAAAIVIEESPEPQPEPSKKKSSGSSPVKRKPVSSGGKKKRR